MIRVAKNKKIIFLLALLGTLVTNSAVLALQVDWPDSPVGTSLDETSELQDLIKYFYEWAVALGGLAVFIVLVFAGFQFLTSAGSPTQMSEAKERIQSAVMGLVLLLGSVLILNTINPELTSFKPLTMPEPSLLGNCEEGDEQGRIGDEYCEYHFGEDYQCKNDVCTIDLAELFKVVDCDSVSIKKDGIETTIVIDDFTTEIELGIDEGFELKANPPAGKKQCMANLILYEGTGFWGGCGGDKRTLAIQPGAVSYDTFGPINGTDIEVKCIKLEKVGA